MANLIVLECMQHWVSSNTFKLKLPRSRRPLSNASKLVDLILNLLRAIFQIWKWTYSWYLKSELFRHIFNNSPIENRITFVRLLRFDTLLSHICSRGAQWKVNYNDHILFGTNGHCSKRFRFELDKEEQIEKQKKHFIVLNSFLNFLKFPIFKRFSLFRIKKVLTFY